MANEGRYEVRWAGELVGGFDHMGVLPLITSCGGLQGSVRGRHDIPQLVAVAAEAGQPKTSRSKSRSERSWKCYGRKEERDRVQKGRRRQGKKRSRSVVVIHIILSYVEWVEGVVRMYGVHRAPWARIMNGIMVARGNTMGGVLEAAKVR